jgi:hypothetical protein
VYHVGCGVPSAPGALVLRHASPDALTQEIKCDRNKLRLGARAAMVNISSNAPAKQLATLGCSYRTACGARCKSSLNSLHIKQAVVRMRAALSRRVWLAIVGGVTQQTSKLHCMGGDHASAGRERRMIHDSLLIWPSFNFPYFYLRISAANVG